MKESAYKRIHDVLWRVERGLPVACRNCGEYPQVKATDRWQVVCIVKNCSKLKGYLRAFTREDAVDLWNRTHCTAPENFDD